MVLSTRSGGDNGDEEDPDVDVPPQRSNGPDIPPQRGRDD